MKKVSITLPTADWGHVKTKYPSSSKYLTPDDFTSGTQNVDTTSKGVLYKRLGGTLYSSLSTAPKDMYEAIFSDGTHHLLTVDNGNLKYSPGDSSETLVTAGYSATANFEFATAFDRVYFCNGAANQVYDKTTTYGGVTYTAPKTKTMGCQVPASAPTAALVVDGTANRVPAGAHTYKITYLYYGSEESNGSAASGVVTNDGTHTSNSLTSIPVGGYGVTARKVYRDNNDSNYVLIATISDNTTTTYTDVSASGGATLPTDNSIPPTSGLILSWLDRLFFAKIAGDPYSLYFSAPGLPDIVYSTNFFKCNQGDPITGVVVFQDRIVVFNRGSMGQVVGRTSDTFRYASIQGGVGCVDNRSIQIRVINGVPTLVWLSDKGVYSYNGSSVSYLSDPVEDVINFNIQQAQQTLGTNTQTTQTDFQGGTASGGIDLSTAPGLITTRNPKRAWQVAADWEGGSSLTNVATKDGTNTIKVPTLFSPGISTGTLAGVVVNGSNFELASTSDFTGASNLGATSSMSGSSFAVGSDPLKFAQPITVTRAGTLTQVSCRIFYAGTPTNLRISAWRDAAGTPGTQVLTGGTFTISSTGTYSDTGSVSCSAGETIWIGFEKVGASGGAGGSPISDFASTSFGAGQFKIYNGSWVTPSTVITNQPSMQTMLCSYSFTSSALAASGQWLSGTYDTNSTSISTTMSITHTGSYPTSCSGTTTVEGSNDAVNFDVTQTLSNANGANSLTVSGRRYWRIRFQLNTTDNRRTPSFGAPTLKFATTTTWISEAIDCTSDVSAFNSLDTVSTQPAGTTIAVSVATSDDNSTYTGFSSFGTALVKRYLKVKVIMTADATDATTPTVTSITLKWTILANLISSAINCGSTPAGWDIFQLVSTTNGGSLTLQMRSATTLGGLVGAFTTVTNGAFPSVTPNQYVQWKAILTSTADAVPTVDSVTINWFISTTNSIRAASMFYNGAYYLAAAEFNQTTNNIVLVLDRENKWRIYRGIDVGTFSLFFNKPYYGRASAGQVIQFLSAVTDQGTNITFDVRTKAFDFFNPKDPDSGQAFKFLREAYVTGVGTGATLTCYYSIDEGTTWRNMQDGDGNTSFTPVNGVRFTKWMTPVFTDGLGMSGRTIMFRIYSSDAHAVEVHNIRMAVTIRKGTTKNV
jgi:hypothetical protein